MMAGQRWGASPTDRRMLEMKRGIVESLSREFRLWYEYGIPEVLPWWKRWLGMKPKRTKLTTEYREIFGPVEK